MIYNNVMLKVKNAEDVETVAELLSEQARLSSEEPGCARFEVYHSQARHKEAKAFIELYLPKVIPLVERVPHLSHLVWP